MRRVNLDKGDGSDDWVLNTELPDAAGSSVHVRVGRVMQAVISSEPTAGSVEVALGPDGRARHRVSDESVPKVLGLVITDLTADGG